MPFRIRYPDGGHTLIEAARGCYWGDGLTVRTDYLLDPDSLRTVLGFLQDTRSGADPEDPWQILAALVPHHAERLEKLATDQMKAALLNRPPYDPEPEDDQ